MRPLALGAHGVACGVALIQCDAWTRRGCRGRRETGWQEDRVQVETEPALGVVPHDVLRQVVGEALMR